MESAGQSHALPDRADLKQARDLVADSDGNLWLLPLGLEKQTVVWNPQTGVAEVFGSYHQALASRVSRKGFSLAGGGLLLPTFSGDGRVCFRDWRIHYFDGEKWRVWESQENAGREGWASHELPFFGPDGRLTVNIRVSDAIQSVQTCQWTGELWQSTQAQPSPLDQFERRSIAPQPAGVPPGAERAPGDPPFAPWLAVIGGRLHYPIAGEMKPVFEATAPDPFTTGHPLERVLRDARGNTFAEIRSRGWIMLPPRNAPDTTLRIEKISEGTVSAAVSAAVSASSGAATRIFWRLDEGQ